MKNNLYKQHVRLFFHYEFDLKTLECLKIIKLAMNEVFKKFSTRYEYIKWRRDSFGGYHNSTITTQNLDIVYCLDLVTIDDRFLKTDATWIEEYLTLLFDKNSYIITQEALSDAKIKIITYIENALYDPSYNASKLLSNKILEQNVADILYPDAIEIVNQITCEDVLSVLQSLGKHLFKVSYFNLKEEKLDRIKKLIPNYYEKKLKLNLQNIKNENLFIEETKKELNSSIYLLAFKFNREKCFFTSDLVFYYLKSTKSFIFEIIREKYGLIYAYYLNATRNQNYFFLEMNIEKKSIELVRSIINDFLISPKKYLSNKKFREIKREFINHFKADSKSLEFLYNFVDNQYFDFEVYTLDEYLALIKNLSYKDFISILQTISLSSECYLKGENNA